MLARFFPNIVAQLRSPYDHLLDEVSRELFLHLPPASRQKMAQRAAQGLSEWQVLAASPVLHKLGQVLARDPRVWPELRDQLKRLESLPPQEDYRQARSTLRGYLPRSTSIGTPLAEGSLAVVFPLKAGGVEAVAKVLKPGIGELLDQELEALTKIGRSLRRCARRLGIPPLDYRATFRRVRGLLLAELDLSQERQNLELGHRFYFGKDEVTIPKPLDWGDRQILPMQRLYGQSLKGNHHQTLVEQVLAAPLFSRQPNAPLHGDLHGGNLMSCSDGSIGVLDWGLALSLSREQRAALVRIAAALLLGRTSLAQETLAELGVLSLSTVESGSLLERADRLLDTAIGQLPGWMVVLRKSLHQLQGLVSPSILESVMTRETLMRLAVEAPHRAFLWPASRTTFGSGLSSCDLFNLVAAPF